MLTLRRDAVSMSAERLGELLIRKELITDEQLAKAVAEQKKEGIRLGAALISLDYIQENDLATFLSKHYGVPSINLSEFEVDSAVIELVPSEVAQKYQLVPVNRAGSTLIIAMSDPSNIFAIDDIKFMTGYNVEVVVAAEAAIKKAIDEFYDQSSSLADVMGTLDDFEDLELVEDAGLDDLADLEMTQNTQQWRSPNDRHNKTKPGKAEDKRHLPHHRSASSALTMRSMRRPREPFKSKLSFSVKFSSNHAVTSSVSSNS
jgi:hypothetical protein